jgi:hypothetical protein
VVPIADGQRPILNKVEGVTLPDIDTAVRVSRDTARIKARIWKAGRMAPRRWGEEIDGTDMGGIAPPIIIIRSSDDVRSGAAPKANRRKEHQRARARRRFIAGSMNTRTFDRSIRGPASCRLTSSPTR